MSLPMASRRKRVIENWIGSSLSNFKHLVQQLQPQNDVDGDFLQNLAQRYQYTDGMSEETFCALNPGLTPAEILEHFESLEAVEELNIAQKTPNSKKKARNLQGNRKRRQKSAIDAILSPERVAQGREVKRKKNAERRLDREFRAQEAAKNSERMAERRLDCEFRAQVAAKIVERRLEIEFRSQEAAKIVERRLDMEFQSQENRARRASYNAREYARFHSSQPLQIDPAEQCDHFFYDLNSRCVCHGGRQVVLRGYEIGPGLYGGWEEYKRSLPTLDADLCLEYAEVRRNIDP